MYIARIYLCIVRAYLNNPLAKKKRINKPEISKSQTNSWGICKMSRLLLLGFPILEPIKASPTKILIQFVFL